MRLKQTLMWLLAFLLLAGCGTTAKYGEDAVEEGLVLRVGVCPDYPPVIYREDGRMSGIEADLADYVGKKLGARVEFVEMEFGDLIPSVEEGKIDIIMSGMSDADYRRDKVRFLPPYMHIGQMALMRKKDAKRVDSYTNLYSTTLRIGCIKDTTGEMFVKENMSGGPRESFKHDGDGIVALKSGKIDVFIDDAPFVLKAAQDNKELSALKWLLTDESLAWAVPRNEGYDGLYERLRKIILHARQSGDLRKILNNYFEIQVKVK